MISITERIINRISRYISKYMTTRAVFILDMGLSLVSSILIILATFVFNDVRISVTNLGVIWISSSLLASVVSFVIMGSFRVIIRHSTVRDISRFVFASFFKVVILGCIMIVCSELFDIVECNHLFILLVSDFVLTASLLICVRIFMIAVYDAFNNKFIREKNVKRILLYSTVDKSVAMIARLQKSSHYKIIGFISSDVSKRRYTISELPVYYYTDRASVLGLHKKLGYDAILFSSEADLKKEQNLLVDFAMKESIQILIAPSIDEFVEGSNRCSGIREVKIEDLLGRDEIKISMDEIISNFKGKTIMVTGAAGSIGSELCRQLAGFGVGKLILYDNAETPMHNLRLELEERFPSLNFVPIIGDVRLERRLDFAFRTHRPSVVFHAAAYKHVPLMEDNPSEAVLVNVAGSRNVANKCLEYEAQKMVMISTDKAVNPTNIMGCTKRLAEIYVQSLGLAVESGEIKGVTKFVTTRFGNVLGSNGSVISRFRNQLAKGGPLTVTHPDINRFFMTIPEACRLVMEAATMHTENRICVFDMGEPVKIDTLARRMILLAGLKPDIDIKIEYTGLRPGEKLYEEVLSNVENTDPTSHDRIRIAHVRAYDYKEASEVVDKLEELSRAVEIPDMVRLMKKTVPEYISNNSRFSEFDAKN